MFPPHRVVPVAGSPGQPVFLRVDARWHHRGNRQRRLDNPVRRIWGVVQLKACVTTLTGFSSLHRLPFRRLYDIRQPNSPFKVLRSIMEVPRSLQYTSDGRFLVIGEGLDLVSIVDAASGYTEGQLLDFFGTAGPGLSCVRAASLFKPHYVSHASLLILLRRRHWRRGGHARCRDAHRVQLRPRVRVLDRV